MVPQIDPFCYIKALEPPKDGVVGADCSPGLPFLVMKRE